MTPEQTEKLREIQERIADVLLQEMDPDNWAGAGVIPAEMSKEERGNRYFDKKSAATTAVIYLGNEKLLANTKEALGRDPYKDDELDEKVAQATKDADKLLKKLRAKNGKVNAKSAG